MKVIKLHSTAEYKVAENDDFITVEVEFLINRAFRMQVPIYIPKRQVYKDCVELHYADKLIEDKTNELEQNDAIWYAAHTSAFNNKLVDVEVDETVEAAAE